VPYSLGLRRKQYHFRIITSHKQGTYCTQRPFNAHRYSRIDILTGICPLLLLIIVQCRERPSTTSHGRPATKDWKMALQHTTMIMAGSKVLVLDFLQGDDVSPPDRGKSERCKNTKNNKRRCSVSCIDLRCWS